MQINNTHMSNFRKEQAQKEKQELYTAIAMGFVAFLAFASLYLSMPI